MIALRALIRSATWIIFPIKMLPIVLDHPSVIGECSDAET